MNPNAAKPRVVILGGGFGGLETAYALRAAMPDQVDITLISERSYFVFRPGTIYIPFGEAEEPLRVDIVNPALRRGIRFIEAKATAIDPERQTITYAHEGEAQTELFDYLVVATGVTVRPDEIPGLREHAQHIGPSDVMLRLRSALSLLNERGKYGRLQNLLIVLPPNNFYSSPLYELAFMIDRWLRETAVRERITMTFATCEESYIQEFGPLLHEMVREHFLERGIIQHKEYCLTRVEPGVAHFANGERLPFDLMINFPPHVAAAQFPALPIDERGFIRTHLASRRVVGYERIYAIGDTSDFPVKQAFLAMLQADAAAEQITADIQGRLPRFVFEPVSKFVMEEFDTGVFAQAPFTSEAEPRVDIHSPQYRAGVSPLWRIGKRMLSTAVPWRFSQGEPFNAGLPSLGIELGLKVMSGVMAQRHEPESIT